MLCLARYKYCLRLGNLCNEVSNIAQTRFEKSQKIPSQQYKICNVRGEGGGAVIRKDKIRKIKINGAQTKVDKVFHTTNNHRPVH